MPVQAPMATTARAVSPVLLVRDVTAAVAYYVDKLGFRGHGVWGDPPTFAVVTRDSVQLMLNQVAPQDSFRPNAAFDGRLSAYVWVDDADALFAEVKARGAEIICEPEDQPWKAREFMVRDRDGHALAFAHDTSRNGT